MILAPKLQLLDAPTANLEDAAKKQAMDRIRRLRSSGKRAGLIASHDAGKRPQG